MKREAGVMAYLHECLVFACFFLQLADLQIIILLLLLGP